MSSVMLRSLRVSAELDSSNFSANSKQIVSDSNAMGNAFGAFIANTDLGMNKLPAGMARLSRMWVDGYRDSEKFGKGLYQIDKALGEGMGIARSVVMLGNLEKAFGRVITQADLTNQKLSALQNPLSQLRVQGGIDQSLGIGAPTSSAGASAAVFSAAAAEEQDRLATSAKRLVGELYPEREAFESLNLKLAEYNAMLAGGVISQDTHTAAGLRAQKNYQYIAENASRMGNNVRLSRFEVQNLGYQFNDIGVQLASGQSPFTTLIQQGAQISQIIGPYGVKGGIKALGSSMLEFLLNPTNLAVVAVAALAAGAVYAYHQMGSGLLPINDLLDKQKKILGDLGQSYSQLGIQVAKLAPQSLNVIRFEAGLNIEQSRKRILEDMEAIRLLASPQPYRQRFATQDVYLKPQNLVFQSAVNDLRDSISKGAPDVEKFRKSISDIASSQGATDQTKKLADAILEGSANMSEFVRQTKQLGVSIDPAFVAMQSHLAMIKPLMGQLQPDKALLSFIPEQKTQQQQLAETLSLLNRHAMTMSEVQGYTEQATKIQSYWNTELSKTAQLNALDLQAIYAKSPAQKASIAAERERVNGINSGVDATTISIKASQAQTLAYQQATYAITEQNRARLVSANDNLRLAVLETNLIGQKTNKQTEERANLSARIDLEKQAYANGSKFDQAQYNSLVAINGQIQIRNDLNAKLKLQDSLNDERLYRSMSPKDAEIFKKLDSSGIERYSAAWKELGAVMRFDQIGQNSFYAGAKTGFDTIIDDANNYAQSSTTLITDAYNNLNDGLTTFITTGKLDFSSLIDGMLVDLAKLELKMLESEAFKALGGTDGILGGLSSLLGGFLGGGGGASIYAMGGAFNDNGVTQFASGSSFTNSIVSSPTNFGYGNGKRGQMGEAGPEAIMPLSRASNGKLGVAMTGGGGNNVSVNIIDMRQAGSPPVEQSQDSKGNPRIIIRDQINSHFSSGDGNRTMAQSFGVKPSKIRRG